MKTCDVAVIGAGMIGVACTHELASAGLRVALVEPTAIAAGATNQSFGSLSIQCANAAELALTRYGLSLWEELIPLLPGECEYVRSGSIRVARTEAAMQEARAQNEFLIREGVQCQLLDGNELAEAEPDLRAGFPGGLGMADDGWMRPGRAAEFLFQAALQKGAEHIPKKAASLAEREVRLEDGSIVYAGSVVNACGSDCLELTPGLPVQFSKGHVMVVESQAECVRHQVMEIAGGSANRGRLAIYQQRGSPGQANEVWIESSGATASGYGNSQVEPRVIASVLRAAIEMAPAVANARPLRSWAALKVTTADGLPLIGRTRQEHIFAATGHDSYGATAALATAKLIADEILLRTPLIDPKPYLPERFERAS